MVFGLTSEEILNLMISMGMVLLTLLVGRWVMYRIVRRLTRLVADHTSRGLEGVLFEAFFQPMYWYVVLQVVRVAIDRLTFVPMDWDNTLNDVYFILGLVILFTALLRLIGHVANWYQDDVMPTTETQIDTQMLPFARRLLMVAVFLTGLIILLSHFNVDVSALVTTLGIGSLAIALAAQESLADTISGFIIMIDRPFRIGDRIEIQDLGTWGDVVDIGLRSSRIRTQDNRMVIVPNSVIGKSLVVNHTFPETKYRVETRIGVAYGVDLELVRETIRRSVQAVEGVLPDHPVEVLLVEFGDSALVFRVLWWLGTYEGVRLMYDRVNSAIYKGLNQAGVVIPFPQRTVHHRFDRGDLEYLNPLTGS